MTRTDVAALDHTLQLTGEWLAQLVREGPFSTHQQGYSWLRAVLHSLRDRPTVEEVTHLASQLPMLVRGFYYEGWRPALAPNQEETRAEFFRSVSRSLDDGGGSNAEMERATKAVFALLEDRLSEGQVRHILSQLPAELQGLWSAEPTPG